MKLLWIAGLIVLTPLACKGEIEGGEEPAAKPAKAKKSNVVRLTTAVPYGTHVACSDVLPDPAPFAEKMGVEVGGIKDIGKGKGTPTFQCSLIRGGEVADAPKEVKTLDEKYAKLGVLPGDEYCRVSAYCSLAALDDDFKAKCEKEGNQLSMIEGDFACLRATEKGPNYSYTYKFIDPDTRCVVEAMAGPSVNEESLVRSCALAAKAAITKAGLANAK